MGALTFPVAVNTMTAMELIFDPARDVVNIHNMGCRWPWQTIWSGIRYWRGPICDGRMARIASAALGTSGRADGRRVISLRKANPREMKRYAET
jgi:hypothetical protein